MWLKLVYVYSLIDYIVGGEEGDDCDCVFLKLFYF